MVDRGKGSAQVTTRRELLGSAGALAAGALVAGCVEPRDEPAPEPLQPRNPDQERSPVRWGFLVDVRRCTGCGACTVACKTANGVRLGVFRTSVRDHVLVDTQALAEDVAPGRRFVPWLCHLCHDPPCIARCPVEPAPASLDYVDGSRLEFPARAIYQRPDGLVLIDRTRCRGCGRCAEACPYQVIYLDPAAPSGGDPERTVADKCTLCVHRLAAGLVPACVATCPTGARRVGNLNDPDDPVASRVAEGDATTLFTEVGAGPRCYYLGLDAHAFVSGSDPKLEAQRLFPERFLELPEEEA